MSIANHRHRHQAPVELELFAVAVLVTAADKILSLGIGSRDQHRQSDDHNVGVYPQDEILPSAVG